jgi:hypothetical protein
MDVPVGQSHYGPELRESDEEKARRLIAEEIATLKFPRLNFSEVKKGDECKIKIAVRLRRETSVPRAGLRRNSRWAASLTPRNSCGKGDKSGTDPFISCPLYDEHLAGAPVSAVERFGNMTKKNEPRYGLTLITASPIPSWSTTRSRKSSQVLVTIDCF